MELANFIPEDKTELIHRIANIIRRKLMFEAILSRKMDVQHPAREAI